MSASLHALTTEGQQQLLASVWRRNLPLLRERLARLQAAADQSSDGVLSTSARRDALEISHKLAGSLGMFGYNQGTEIARRLEVLLDEDGPVAVTVFLELTGELHRSLPVD